MLVLVFDTETTGLPPKQKEISYEPAILEKWPHVVQLSYLLYDTQNNALVKVRDFILRLPENTVISQESIALHGITYEISKTHGIEMDVFIKEMLIDFLKADLIVAHNLEFDLNLLKVECMRKIIAVESEHINSGIGVKQIVTRSKQRKYETEHNWYRFLNLLKIKTNFYCTMQESVELCNIKKTNSLGEYLKFPKLSELHETLFKSSPKNLHNSLNDILICLRCFYKLRLNEDLLEKNMEIKKMLERLL